MQSVFHAPLLINSNIKPLYQVHLVHANSVNSKTDEHKDDAKGLNHLSLPKTHLTFFMLTLIEP